MVSHRWKPNSAVHHFRPTEATLWHFGKILHFLDLQWLYSKFIFQYLPNGNMYICSRAIFRPLRRGFLSSRFFTFLIISADVAVYFRSLPLCQVTLPVSLWRAMVRDAKDLFSTIHWRALTIATCGFPAKYKATALYHAWISSGISIFLNNSH